MIDLGEVYAGGIRPDGRAWQVGVADAGAAGGTWKRIVLQDQAVATSSDSGYSFSANGRFTHLIDPRTGRSPRLHKSISVTARDAATADALSTAFAVMPFTEIERVVGQRKNLKVIGRSNKGAMFELVSN